jgi:hypothetical protein
MRAIGSGVMKRFVLAFHTDNPVEFSADMVDFITLGNIEQSPLAVVRLVNGATTVGQASAPGPSPSGPSPTVGLNK